MTQEKIRVQDERTLVREILDLIAARLGRVHEEVNGQIHFMTLSRSESERILSPAFWALTAYEPLKPGTSVKIEYTDALWKVAAAPGPQGT
jgi:hypothetical protein